MFASAEGHENVVELLLANGAEVDLVRKINMDFEPEPQNPKHQHRAVFFAAARGHLRIMQILLAAGAASSYIGWGAQNSLLLVAAVNGHVELTEFLAPQSTPEVSTEIAVSTIILFNLSSMSARYHGFAARVRHRSVRFKLLLDVCPIMFFISFKVPTVQLLNYCCVMVLIQPS